MIRKRISSTVGEWSVVDIGRNIEIQNKDMVMIQLPPGFDAERLESLALAINEFVGESLKEQANANT